ncbi:hypothetical protein TNCV_2780521 [Trichonephila clavipes]|nr:hypothetical protein TNCV_2780521 [Trichonephila clavipes]
MQHEDPVLSPIIQKIDQNDVSPQVSNYFINREGLLCHLSKRPSRSPRSSTTRKQVCIPHCLKSYGHSQKRHISSYSAHVNGRVEKPNQSLANILASIPQNTNDWDEQLPHTKASCITILLERRQTKSVGRWDDCPSSCDMIGRGHSLAKSGRENGLGRSENKRPETGRS